MRYRDFAVIAVLVTAREQDGAVQWGTHSVNAQRIGLEPAVMDAIGSWGSVDRLNEKGYLRSTFGEPTPERGGRPRRFYRVSSRGMAALRSSLAVVSSMTEGLDAVLDPS